MDRNQVHKIGKIMNKPVKFVKENAGEMATVLTAVVSVVALIDGKKNRFTVIHRIKFG
ncbi:hypothetical protein NML69_07950 [Streptococcus sp. CF8-6]|jgi:hypothetical protein|uniref:hypothetical protein n=1 Tax=Streptococcus sp. CF8-6 TaxID=2963150 RepID=UPI0020C8E777|nr:hypothetical protein [Streptococcus sp. CF8-6]MCP9017913.1 hypothetical protein [Streptococcus sp. CF8-6]